VLRKGDCHLMFKERSDALFLLIPWKVAGLSILSINWFNMAHWELAW